MSLVNTPIAEQLRIVITGLRNAGKSSLFNSIIENNIAIVSNTPGTTTDPVIKSMEMGNLGPVVFVDTAGIDDIGELGQKRIDKTYNQLEIADIIIFVTKINEDIIKIEKEFLNKILKLNKKILIVFTFSDFKHNQNKLDYFKNYNTIIVNNNDKETIKKLREKIIAISNDIEKEIKPLDGLVDDGDLLFLVVPIDSAAPKGRLILPQVETIRDALDKNCSVLIAKENQLDIYYSLKKRPKLVITDSQAFEIVKKSIPEDQPLTSFSILFARKKGDFNLFLKSIKYLKNIKSGSKILINESCTHHRQPDDIGTVKIPNLFKSKINKDVTFDFYKELPNKEELKKYSLVIMCGGCMVTRNKILSRLKILNELNIPVINYGFFLAYVNNLLPRTILPFYK
ncbi:MAG: [FeFe] hydrogenase H-cluster maturation GTPase HydF [Candidatus Goldbacteria bacterium]|nr:[FeFe] hydrogenase H-cluster maturation GTPase HydF [Candidatus Goldiibacteriota bacterium]